MEIATGFFAFAFADPIRALVTLILLAIAYAVLNFRKGIKDDLADYKDELKTTRNQFTSILDLTKGEVEKIKNTSANLVGEIHGVKLEMKKLETIMAEDRTDRAKRVGEYAAATDRFNNAVRKLMELTTKIEKGFEENKIIEANYGKIVESIAELRKRKGS